MDKEDFKVFFDSFKEVGTRVFKEYKHKYFESDYQKSYIVRNSFSEKNPKSLFSIELQNADNTPIANFDLLKELVESIFKGELFAKSKHYADGLSIIPACWMFLDGHTMAALAVQLKEWIEENGCEEDKGWVMSMFLDGISLKFYQYSEEVNWLESIVNIFIHFPTDCIQPLNKQKVENVPVSSDEDEDTCFLRYKTVPI